MIVRTCCKLTLDDCLQPDSFAVLNVVPVPCNKKSGHLRRKCIVVCRCKNPVGNGICRMGCNKKYKKSPSKRLKCRIGCMMKYCPSRRRPCTGLCLVCSKKCKGKSGMARRDCWFKCFCSKPFKAKKCLKACKRKKTSAKRYSCGKSCIKKYCKPKRG